MSSPHTLLSVIQGPAFGGAHNQALQLAPLLERLGYVTAVALPAEAEPAAARLRAGGVETVTLPLGRLRARLDPGLQARFIGSLPADVRRLRSLIERLGADVVQVHGITNGQGAVAARLEGTGVVWQLFDTRAPMALRRAGMPMLVGLADAVTTWGEELGHVHPGVARFGDRWITVYPPVDRERFAPDLGLRARARARLGVSDGERLIGSIGVLNPQKGHEHLIEAAAIVHQRQPTARFVILGGSSPAHANYERGLHELVRARGLTDYLQILDPGTEVPLLLQAFDVFAMASVPRSEGMPTVILEAMSSRVPVVSTRVGAVAELVEHGKSGLLVPPLSPGLVAEALLRLLLDEDLRRDLAAAGFSRAARHFDRERLAELHAEAYRVAIERRGSG